MSETDSTRSTASGGHRPDDDEAAAGRSGARAAVPGDVPVAGVAQRDLREAGTLPEARPGEDPEERPGSEEGARADGGDPETRMLPVVQDGPRLDDTGTRSADAPHRGAHVADDGSNPTVNPYPTPGAGPADRVDGAEAGASTGAEAAVPSPVAQPSAGAQSGGSHASAVHGEPSTDTGALSVRPPDRDAARRAAVRDQAVAAKPALPRFLQVVVALFFPVIVVAAAVRAVATSSFLWLEYHRPGFPADQFGFSLDDRMTYGSYALDYVVNLAPPRYLGGLVTPEGDPLFLESEVGHMADVKGVLGLSFLIALVLFVLAVLACVYLARKYKGGVRRALFSGAVLTLVGIAVLTVLAVLAWETFFTQVHALFFANGTWTFRIDDTLIRLFPEQFWTDSAVTIAVLVLAATVLTLVLTWPTRARRERSMLAQEAAQARYREALEAS
ncbi:TIGR01906 family membrane protein [Arthrobacter sp. MDT3-44]